MKSISVSTCEKKKNFEEYANCGHEGTNRAIKKGDDAVNPC